VSVLLIGARRPTPASGLDVLLLTGDGRRATDF